MAKPRGITREVQRAIRRHQAADLKTVRTNDSFQNFQARLGIGTDNLSSADTYGFNPITRVRTLLEWMYRGSWLVGQAVDCIAEDMTKAGVSYHGELSPDSIDQLTRAWTRLMLWEKLQETLKWSRLYGGSLAVMLIDGQDTATPLRLETVGKGAFKGLQVMDRWMVEPSLNDLVTDIASPDLGQPKFYRVSLSAPALPRMTIHHSRVVRFIGIKLPYWQEVSENLWGMSVVERIYDRLVAFDSGTQGASQLLYKAYLRTMKVPQLRDIVATGGKALEGLLAQVAMMRTMQSNEGITLMDAEDTFETTSYSFAGVSDTLLQFGQQLSGALQIPLVRLFGQSPTGMNSTGESDIRTYYDGISQRQNTTMRHPVDRLSRVVAQSEGVKLDNSFGFDFNPLWEMDDKEKAEVAKTVTETVLAADTAGVCPPGLVLKELKQQSKLTGIWTNITDEDIKAAETAPLPGVDEALNGLLNPDAGLAPEPGIGGEEPPQPGKAPEPRPGARPGPPSTLDALPLLEVHGIPIQIESAKGERRSGNGWEVVMPEHYGLIRRTGSAEGADEAMDCFIGPNLKSRDVWVIDQRSLETNQFDEHKVMLGFNDAKGAVGCYLGAYHERAQDRIMAMTRMSVDQLKTWLAKGDLTRPVSRGVTARPPEVPGQTRAA